LVAEGRSANHRGSRAAASGKHASKQAKTLSGEFRASLADLMVKLNTASPHFVRCIKPNLEKRPGLFSAAMVAQQLRYTGVMATTRIRAEGFPLRLTFQDFIDQCVSPSSRHVTPRHAT
jgi:myosin heavy subunit